MVIRHIIPDGFGPEHYTFFGAFANDGKQPLLFPIALGTNQGDSIPIHITQIARLDPYGESYSYGGINSRNDRFYSGNYNTRTRGGYLEEVDREVVHAPDGSLFDIADAPPVQNLMRSVSEGTDTSRRSVQMTLVLSKTRQATYQVLVNSLMKLDAVWVGKILLQHDIEEPEAALNVRGVFSYNKQGTFQRFVIAPLNI